MRMQEGKYQMTCETDHFIPDEVTCFLNDDDGNGIFYVNGGSVSVWIKKDNMHNL